MTGRQTLKARKALRSAAAKKGWEARRAKSDASVYLVAGVAYQSGAEARAALNRMALLPPRPAPDPNPWPRFKAAIRRLLGLPT